MEEENVDQLEFDGVSRKRRCFSIIESLLFTSGEPLSIDAISSIMQCNKNFTEDIMKEMSKEYEAENRGIKVIRINNNYQLVTKPQNSAFIQKLLKTNSRQSLSQAALETIAIIAYRQPVTKIDIDEIRGVKSDSAIITLAEKGLIKENGRLDAPGRPILYSTTNEFLKQFGLEKIEDMPSIKKLFDEKE